MNIRKDQFSTNGIELCYRYPKDTPDNKKVPKGLYQENIVSINDTFLLYVMLQTLENLSSFTSNYALDVYLNANPTVFRRKLNPALLPF